MQSLEVPRGHSGEYVGGKQHLLSCCEPLENWLLQRVSPKIEFQFYSVELENKRLVLFEIPQACGQPILFHTPYTRIGSVTRKLNEFPEKERKIWMSSPDLLFAKEVALRSVSAAQVIEHLDTQAYFDLLVKTPYPTTQEAVIERLLSEHIIIQNRGAFDITNLGGLLFAKDLKKFPSLVRKAPRVVVYEGQDKLKTKRDTVGSRGYAVGFQLLIQYITSQLLANNFQIEEHETSEQSIVKYKIDVKTVAFKCKSSLPAFK